MRIPLAVSLESRDGTTGKDSKVQNALVEVKGEAPYARKRPGVYDLGTVKVGTAQLLTVWNGIKTVQGDYINTGTIVTIVSAPTQTNLTPTNAGLAFEGQATNNDAATPRLMIKNRTQAWTVTRAGTVSAVSYASSMGAGTYNLLSLTRSGTTATGTLAEDVFNVGDSVTIAGADQADYNGAQTVTAVTTGSTTPAVDVPITLTRSSTTATATTVGGVEHGLTNGSSYTIAGANQSAYNGSKTVTVTGTTTFTYTVTVTPASTITWNSADKGTGVTLSGGDLTAAIVSTGGAQSLVRATASKTSGKWYWEVTINSMSSALGTLSIGVAKSTASLSFALGVDANGWSFYLGTYKLNSNTLAAYGSGTFDAGDVIGVALDLDSGTLTFYKNGVSEGQAFSGISGTIFPAVSNADSASSITSNLTVNLGATSFTHSVPTGYYAYQSDDPLTPATGTIIVTRPAVTVNSTFNFTVAGSPATPATGTITAQGTGGTVPGIAYINGYFCVMDVNGVIWHSNSDDPTTWGALAFTTAQVENGAGKALAKSNNYLVALKEWSTELFYDAQNATGSVFSPVENGFTRIGCANGFSVAEVDGKLFWIAQTREEKNRAVYMGAGTDQVKISTPDVDRIVSRDNLSTVYAFGLSIDGHKLYVLTMTNTATTLVYDLDAKTWTTWTSMTRGNSQAISTVTRSGDWATITFSAAHGMSDGAPVEISGATQTEYNGIFQLRYVSTTVIKIKVSGDPTTPATGTIVGYKFSETYFKYTKAASYLGRSLLLHETDGGLYELTSGTYRDDGIPVDTLIRTTKLDGGTTVLKKMSAMRIIGDKINDIAMIRWSDQDSADGTRTWYRPINLNDEPPEIRRCGAFRRRTIEFRHTGNNSLQIAALEADIT